MTRSLPSPATHHEQARLRDVYGWKPQSELVRERDIARRFDDEPGESGESALTVLNKSLIVRTSESRAIQVWSIDGHRQLTVGTEDEAHGGEPFLTIGEDLDVAGYRLRMHGRKGHLHAPAGMFQAATVNPAKRHSGVNKDNGATTLTTWGSAAWTPDTFTSGDTTTDLWGLWTTSGSINDPQGPNGPADYGAAYKTEAFFRVQMGAAITNERVWIGLFSGDPSGSSTPALDFAGVRYHAGTDTTWLAYCGDGTNRTNANTTVTVAANQAYNIWVRTYPTFAQIVIGLPEIDDGFTDGTFTQTLTTTLPRTSVLLSPYVRITNITSAAAVSIKFGHANFLSGAAGSS